MNNKYKEPFSRNFNLLPKILQHALSYEYLYIIAYEGDATIKPEPKKHYVSKEATNGHLTIYDLKHDRWLNKMIKSNSKGYYFDHSVLGRLYLHSFNTKQFKNDGI